MHALLELMQLKASQKSFAGQDQAIIEVMGVREAVLIGQQGVEGGTDLGQTATGLVFTSQAVDRETEDQADVPQGDSCQGGIGGRSLLALRAVGNPSARQRQRDDFSSRCRQVASQ